MRRNLKSSAAKSALLLGLFLAGVGVGRICPTPPTTQAQPQETPRRKAFKSGGERAETVLREISARLKTMDGRVAGIEDLLKKRLPKQ